MFGGRGLFYKAKKVHDAERAQLLMLASKYDADLQGFQTDVEAVACNAFLRRLYQQAKQISQTVSFIWRWADEEETSENRKAARALMEYFEHPTPDPLCETHEDIDVSESLKRLLGSNPRDPDPTPEGRLLRQVFPDYDAPAKDTHLIFPMFDRFELGEEFSGLGYWFLVNINSFHGEIKDPTPNIPELFSFAIPYPPCPALGAKTVTRQELDAWIRNREQDQYFSRNPFIPTSCC